MQNTLEDYSGDVMHRDHIVPVVVGATDDYEHLIVRNKSTWSHDDSAYGRASV